MIVLWIILGVIAAIVLLLFILLHFSVKAYVEADKKHVHLEVKYLGFKLYKMDLPDESKKQDEENETESEDSPIIELSEIPETDSTDSSERPKEAEQPTEDSKDDDKPQEEKPQNDSSESDEEKASKPSLLDQYNEFKKYIPAGKKAFRKLLKLIRFYDLKFRLTVGDDDPYKAGLNFGRINIVVYNALALLCCIFSVKIDSTEIKCDFEKKTTDFYVSTAVYVRPSAVVALAAYLGIYYLKIRKSMKKLEKIAKEKTNNE